MKEYAYNCLDADAPAVRVAAWHHVLLAKDPRAKERFFAALSEEGSKEPPYLRSRLLPLHFVAYDEERENDLLIDMLRPDSWVAKG